MQKLFCFFPFSILDWEWLVNQHGCQENEAGTETLCAWFDLTSDQRQCFELWLSISEKWAQIQWKNCCMVGIVSSWFNGRLTVNKIINRNSPGEYKPTSDSVSLDCYHSIYKWVKLIVDCTENKMNMRMVAEFLVPAAFLALGSLAGPSSVNTRVAHQTQHHVD